MPEDRYEAILSLKESTDISYTLSVYCAMFGIPVKNFYAWFNRRTVRIERKRKEALKQATVAQRMKEIIEKLQMIPGARGFKIWLRRLYGIDISRKRARKIMKEFGFIATVKRKDPYLGHDTHGLSCIAMNNHVNGDFLKGPREIILTDITYVFYGEDRKRIYVCAFFDPFTNQVLGFSMGRKMDTALVAEAFNMMIEQLMIENHARNKQEFRNAMLGKTTYVHSDEGSQFMSHRFRDLLDENGLLQSMSDRGCSTDNAPIEALWSTFKAYVPVERAANFQQACTMIETFVDKYNNEYIQSVLSFLTPAQYYNYVMDPNHIYPCKDCFGVDQDDLIGPDAFESICRKRRRQRSERRKENERNRRERARSEDTTQGKVAPRAGSEALNEDGSLKSEYHPVRQTERCIFSLKKFKMIWENVRKGYEDTISNAELMIRKINTLIHGAEKGRAFLKSLTPEDLKRYGHDRDLWEKTPELRFAFDYEEFLENLA